MTRAYTSAPVLGFALTIRFVLELALLAGAAVFAWQLDTPWRWVGVIAAPLAVAVVWGLFLSPKAAIALPAASRLSIETVLLLGVGAGLIVIGPPVVALLGVATWLANRIALLVLG